MNPVRHIRRLGATLAGLAGALLAFTAAAAAAFAMPVSSAPPGLLQQPPVLPPEPGMIEPPAVLPAQVTGPVTGPVTGSVHAVVIGGMPDWQIALIAIGAALLAATIAVLLDRARAIRRNAVTVAA
jgi:hypothetical protein